MTRREFRDTQHFLTITEDSGEVEVEVLHPEGCPTGDIGNGMQGHTCAISSHLYEFGLDLHLADVPPGMYLATYWYVPSGWAGAAPLDATDGIELARLQEVAS